MNTWTTTPTRSSGWRDSGPRSMPSPGRRRIFRKGRSTSSACARSTRAGRRRSSGVAAREHRLRYLDSDRRPSWRRRCSALRTPRCRCSDLQRGHANRSCAWSPKRRACEPASWVAGGTPPTRYQPRRPGDRGNSGTDRRRARDGQRPPLPDVRRPAGSVLTAPRASRPATSKLIAAPFHPPGEAVRGSIPG